MTSRLPLGSRTAATDNVMRGQQSSLLPNHHTSAPFTPSKSPRHSRFQNPQQRTSNPVPTAQTTHTQPQRLTRHISSNDSLPPLIPPQHPQHNNNATQSTQQRTTEDPNDFSNLYNRRDLPRSPISPDQLVTIFERWLGEYRLSREKLTQIKAQNSQKAMLWAQQQSLSVSNGPTSSSPVAIPINESASIQALFTPVFFQSVIYTFRALLFKQPSLLTLDHLDTFVEIVLYGLHMQDIHIKHACCLVLREMTECSALTTAQSPQSQPLSLLQRSVIGSVIKPLATSRTNAIFGPVFDDLEITTRLLCQSLHFALVPELCALIEQQLNQVYTPQLLSYIRSLFYSFQCGRAVLYTNGADSTIKFKQHDVDCLLVAIVQLCTYQGHSNSRSASLANSHFHGTSGDLAEVKIYGGALLRAIGGTFPLSKTLAAVKALPPNFQVIIGDVCSRVLKVQANSPDISDDVLMKRLLYTVRNSGTTAPPTTLPTFTTFLQSTPNQLPNLSEGTGNNLLEHNPFEINHTFQQLNTGTTGCSTKHDQYYQSLYDHQDRTIYIPYLLLGPAQGHSRGSVDKMMGKGKEKEKKEDEMIPWSEALADRSSDKLNASRDSVLSGISSIHEASVGRYDSFTQRSPMQKIHPVQTEINPQLPRTKTNPLNPQTLVHPNTDKEPQVKYVTETISKQIPVPSVLGCFASQHPQHCHHNQNATYTSLDREADALIQLYQAYKSNPTALTKVNFETMMSTSQKITKAMFTLSTTQINALQQPQAISKATTTTSTVTSTTTGTTRSAAPISAASTPTTTQSISMTPIKSKNTIPMRKLSTRISDRSRQTASPPQLSQKRPLIDRADFDCGSDGEDFRSSQSSLIRHSESGAHAEVRLGSGPTFRQKMASARSSPFSDHSDDDDDLIGGQTQRVGNYSLRTSADGTKKQRLGM